MNVPLVILAVATALLALGMWLLLPRVGNWTKALGAVLVAGSLGLFVSQTPGLQPGGGITAGDIVFDILASVTIWSAIGTVTFRNPVYASIWFALSLLGTAGLFLFDGAQFLGVATVVVYAGAILVTFLFVLMLAQPEGHAAYDRTSWAARLSAATGAIVVGLLTVAVVNVFQNPDLAARPTAPYTTPALAENVLASEHMAHLGGQLFSRHLVAIEVAGTLLLVALVGSVAVITQMRRDERGAKG